MLNFPAHRPIDVSVLQTVSNVLSSASTSLWYKSAVIYEVHVRAFCDSDRSGAGDFKGLIQKLDYIQDLGVTAIWLLPFCPSPWRDDGYDISDFVGVHPAYGCLDDFREFLDHCRQRQLRVITELVLNHTSDQHPWFERARRSPAGSAFRDYYVWSDTPDRYHDVRVIFTDFERSNWTWDPVAEAWYWHRFYSHQPDLNFDSSAVRRAVFETVDFWFGLGVDGLRLDAVPYLFERENTTCENLPETHAFLRELRAYVDNRYTDRMLLAEANQWPEDAIAYFGKGDECHMAFNFPLMPRLFMATRTEDSFPITNIIEKTPKPPDGCQWATFLRNHDELTLEMVCDEERDYMYRAYAEEPEMRVNVGIRRRLAPLLGNDQRRIRLMNALLFSLPGTPVIYYGDEIGMGEDLSLGDRNSVRTPMQWTAGENAGFSSADARSLFLPVISSGAYAHDVVNVERQITDRDSLLWWMRQALSLRAASDALTSGDIEFIPHRNRHVLAFVRKGRNEDVLVVANLSRYAQPVQLPLGSWADQVPVEAFGRVEFPAVDTGLYQLSLAPYGFYWFLLRRSDNGSGPADTVPVIDSFDWNDRVSLASLLLPHLRNGDVTRPRATTLAEVVDIVKFTPESALVFCEVRFSAGDTELHQVPLSLETPSSSAGGYTDRRVVARVRGSAQELCVNAANGPMSNTLAALATAGDQLPTSRGVLSGTLSAAVDISVPCENVCLMADSPSGLQRNTSVLLSDLYALKLFRQLEPGDNPEIDTVRYLFEEANFANVPAVFGKLVYTQEDGRAFDAGVLHAFINNRTDLWQLALDELSLYLERVATSKTESVGTAALMQGWSDICRLLGRRTGQMHLALAGPPGSKFAPEAFDAFSLRGACHSMSSRTSLISARFQARGTAVENLESAVRDRLREADAAFAAITHLSNPGLRIRIHGDFHLGQVLHTGDDLVFIDFEGDSSRPLAERRLKTTPLVDVAGMLHSFEYAAASATASRIPGSFGWERRHDELRRHAARWCGTARDAFLSEYRRTTNGSAIVPSGELEFRRFLRACHLAKAVYQLGYELENRPDWFPVAVRTFLEVAERDPELTDS